MAIDHAAHHQHVRDRLAIEPMRMERTRPHHPHPRLRVPQAPEIPVLRGGENSDGPAAILGWKGENRDGAELAHRGAAPFRSRAAEVARIIVEVAVAGFLRRRGDADLRQPLPVPRSAPAHVDDEVRAQLLAVTDADTGYVCNGAR